MTRRLRRRRSANTCQCSQTHTLRRISATATSNSRSSGSRAQIRISAYCNYRQVASMAKVPPACLLGILFAVLGVIPIPSKKHAKQARQFNCSARLLVLPQVSPARRLRKREAVRPVDPVPATTRGTCRR
jgi:hypothetical protein